MDRTWALRRRIQYGLGVGVFVLLVLSFAYTQLARTTPSCFDGKQNGDERGVDCGGSCQRVCAFDVTEPQIRWSQSFRVTDGQYNVVAYVENRNRDAGVRDLEYRFILYDEQGDVITERAGTTPLPPDGVYPIFEGAVSTNGVALARTFVELDADPVWLSAAAGREQFEVRSRQLFDADVRPRLSARVYNTSLDDERDVEIVATIFNASGIALTASRSVVPLFLGREEREVVFTWPEPIAKTVRSCEVPSDIMVVLDRSGSMAADGGNPPEPLESAKNAAIAFVEQLRAEDQVGYFSYATTPSFPLEQLLTRDRAQAAAAIGTTRMGSDGIQYTNMGDAITAAHNELRSARGRDNARKVIVFLTDGDVTRPVNPTTGARDIAYAAQYARDAADSAHESGVTIYTIGFGDFFLEASGVIERDLQLLRDLASEPELFFQAPTRADLARVYRDIVSDICEEGAAVIDIVPKTTGGFDAR